MCDTPRVFLSRRNLLTLLSKLDRKAKGEETACTLLKRDTAHKDYPQNYPVVLVTTVEDKDYYTDRTAGEVHPADTP